MKLSRKSIKPARIEMLPLIDIVFLLLVFFIYAMLSMAVHRGLQLDLPESSQAEHTRESPLSLTIRAGVLAPEIFINEQPVSLASIVHNLKGDPDTSDQPTVLVFAEETITYQQLYEVLDELKKGGIKNISLQASSE